MDIRNSKNYLGIDFITYVNMFWIRVSHKHLFNFANKITATCAEIRDATLNPENAIRLAVDRYLRYFHIEQPIDSMDFMFANTISVHSEIYHTKLARHNGFPEESVSSFWIDSCHLFTMFLSCHSRDWDKETNEQWFFSS